VRDAERLGIFTNTGLQRAIVDGRALDALPVRDLATFDLVTIAPDEPLFDALAVMIKHQVHRLVVADGERIVGLLEQLDLLSFLSNHSYLITVQIVQAQDLDTLKAAAQQVTRLVTLMYRGGTRVSQIGKLVQALNAKLFERAWQLIAPPELVADSCLFVMGSEGRGEQLLKTDQDNGLIVRDNHASADYVAELCARFSAALREFGYPDCPGGIMVSNPAWRRSARLRTPCTIGKMPAFFRSSVCLSCSPISSSRFHQAAPPDSGNESIAAAKRPSNASSLVTRRSTSARTPASSDASPATACASMKIASAISPSGSGRSSQVRTTVASSAIPTAPAAS